MEQVLMHINYIAVVAAGALYWLVGMIWFPWLFGKVWAAELANIGIVIGKPSSNEIAKKSVSTFAINTFTAFGVAIFLLLTETTTIASAVELGLLLSLFFSVAIICVSGVWESRSLKLIMIDSGYHIFGIVACAFILSLWK